MKINRKLFPVKAHYFFFMAAMGPILPQVAVFGKQLGISTLTMGIITGVLPILFLIAKPAFGFLADYFLNRRKAIFIGIIVATCISFCLFSVLPKPIENDISEEYFNFTSTSNNRRICRSPIKSNQEQCVPYHRVYCSWDCPHGPADNSTVTLILYKNNNSMETCYILQSDTNECFNNPSCSCHLFCNFFDKISNPCLPQITFWGFIVLMSVGCIGFNVSNSISDAICFDVLGPNNEPGYGMQRVWGTIGYGITAFLAGALVDFVSNGDVKNFTPMYVTITVMTIFDLISCRSLKLPKLQSSSSIIKDLMELIKHVHIVIFLMFAVFIGIIDSFIAFFLFWFLEDLAIETDNMHHIKLLEGLTVAAQTLGSELIFFLISGKILKKIGYGHSFTLCFLFYGLRLGLVSFLTSPWWILPMELFLQGPTYAMGYTTIVAYTSAVSPPGTSATMQGIAAGMDDGFGYAIGSVIGGYLFNYVGGKNTLRIFSFGAIVCGVIHFILYITILRKSIPKIVEKENVEYKSPNEAVEITDNVS